MLRSSLTALALAFIMLASAERAYAQVRGVSALEAQELSVEQLARRLLGDVGAALIIDVDRPRWGEDAGAWARYRGPSPAVPTPFYELVFYARPTYSAYGVCEQVLITVHFAREARSGARQLPDNVRTETRFGVAGELRPPEGLSPSEYRGAQEALCATQPAGRDYFPAPGGGASHQAALITEYLATLGDSGESPGFRFTCQTFSRPCEDPSETLSRLTWREIRSVEATNCGPGPHTIRFPRCFTIVYGITYESGRREYSLGYQTLRVVAGFSARDLTIESAEIRFDSALH